MNRDKNVKEGNFYYNAPLWATEKESTNGTAADVLSSLSTNTRNKIVTFL